MMQQMQPVNFGADQDPMGKQQLLRAMLMRQMQPQQIDGRSPAGAAMGMGSNALNMMLMSRMFGGGGAGGGMPPQGGGLY